MQQVTCSPSLYVPYEPEAGSYLIDKSTAIRNGHRCVPPKATWISEKYGSTDEEYLASGQRDIDQMIEILRNANVSLDAQGHILEFGCGDGRMIRWLEALANDREIWGTDINAGRILWCKQNLSPPFHFLTNTAVPHLPFEDQHFSFIFAGSVFTHIDDLADAWFAELRRLLRLGGKLFVTIHLKNDIELLNGKYRSSGLAKRLHNHPDYERIAQCDFDVFTMGRQSDSYVFYDLDYLRKSIEPMFRILSITEEVRLYQNALLLERV